MAATSVERRGADGFAPPAQVGAARPAPTLTLKDAVAITVGIVVGAGIFRAPSLVAGNAGSEGVVMLLWLAGGAISLVGALCYAELATTFPNAGGDYHFLRRAYGKRLGFLFAWSRASVIQTGSVALLAFIFGDYASQLLRLGPFSPALYAGLVVAGLTALNVAGVRQGTRTQNWLTGIEVFSLLLVIGVGLFLVVSPTVAVAPATETTATGQMTLGLALVFVLLTYGGWNEAAYVSAEVKGDKRNLAWALILSIGIITLLYLLVNWAYLRGLGMQGVAESRAVAADLMRVAAGERGAQFVSLLVAIAALTSANATVFTGGRTNYAFGRDFRLFRFLGRWNSGSGTPANALIVQGVLALILVAAATLGGFGTEGFETMVAYTAPVFWFFFFLTGMAVIVLRFREPNAERPFRVPLYPVTPIIFCAACAYMLQSSLAYAGRGALVGIAVLLVGVPLLWLARRRGDEGVAGEERTS